MNDNPKKKKVTKSKITSTVVYIIYAVLMIGGLIWATFKPEAPFAQFAEWFTIGSAAYWAKRVAQRHSKFSNYQSYESSYNSADSPHSSLSGPTFTED